MIRTAILTISDKASQGLREDLGGPVIQRLLDRKHYLVTATAIVPDDIPLIVKALVDWADREKMDLILTTGGTGVSPRDITPEATAQVLHKEIPGMAEAMRAEGLRHTPWLKSRGQKLAFAGKR